LKKIHKKNLIHRDLKPENIFFKSDLKLIIGDFGVAKQLKNGTIHANTQIGTFQYMAPEILRNEKYSNKVDIYALGCIIYELCTLNFYFGNKTEGKIDVSLFGNDLQNLIDKLVEKEPNKRPCVDEIYKMADK
jgi:NIMA (never in mitosis gene a)-related kinase